MQIKGIVQKIPYSEWVPFEWEIVQIVDKKYYNNPQVIWSRVEYRDVFISCFDSFWRHPFTTCVGGESFF